MGGEHRAYFGAIRAWEQVHPRYRLGANRHVPSDAQLAWGKALRDGSGEALWSSTRYAGFLLWLPCALGADRGLAPEVFLRAVSAGVGAAPADGAPPRHAVAWHRARAALALGEVESAVGRSGLLDFPEWERDLWCPAWGAVVDVATAARIDSGFDAYQRRLDEAADAVRAAVPWRELRDALAPA